METDAEPRDLRVLLLTPTPRDATISARIFREAEIACRACSSLVELCHELKEGAGAVLLNEEALKHDGISCLTAFLEEQAPWSDLPVLVLTQGGHTSPTAAQALAVLGNTILLERPVRVGTLVSAVRMALRSRRRQYQLREHLLERERNEQQLRVVRDGLERRVQERTAELEAFSYSVSHDLQAPLRVIEGFSQALLEDYGKSLEPEALHYLARIQASVSSMSELIRGLLRLAHASRQVLVYRLTDLSALAENILAGCQTREPERQVELRVEKGLLARGDEKLIEIALTNLLENAWKFTRHQTRARIAFGMQDGVFFVQDNGAGFDPLDKDKLFAAFQRLPSATDFEGSGIGLATVKRIIERHGGRIWARGKEGGGATFYFTLATPPT